MFLKGTGNLAPVGRNIPPTNIGGHQLEVCL